MQTKTKSFALCAGAIALFAACQAIAQPFAADSLYDDWAGIPIAASDPSGDAVGVFDITTVFVASVGTDLFIRFDTTATRNLIAGSGVDGSFRVDITVNNKLLRLDYRNRSVRFDGSFRSWVQIGAKLHSTYAANQFELRVDLASVGASQGDTVAVNFSGSDTLATDIAHTLNTPAVSSQRRDPAQHQDVAFRIASLNTLQTGTSGGTQAQRLGRLIDAVDAAVYCLQEEYNSSTQDIESFLASIDPLGNGLPWNVVKVFDNVVASQFALHAVPSNDSSYAAAVVDFGNGDAVLVFSIHPKCCGFIGSSEDQRRINQATALRNTIDNFQAGAFNSTLDQFAGAPVIVVGDWNLVGSRTPLDIVLGSDQQELILRNLIGQDVVTWQSAGSSFPPGRLDLLTHASSNLFPLHSFILDTTRLNTSELTTLGLQTNDSFGSDHYMLVADFAFEAPEPTPDFNSDGFVDGTDLILILGAWATADSAFDLNSNGTVDGADLLILLGNWGPIS